jgi:hypothetical protein
MSVPQAEIPDPRLVFLERAATRLQLVNSDDMTLDEAIDYAALRRPVISSSTSRGPVTLDDFLDFLPSGERFPQAYALQNDLELALLRQRQKYGAAASSIEALMLSLRARGEAALVERACQQRLAELSSQQIRDVISRLIGIRAQYAKITDELLFELGEQQ